MIPKQNKKRSLITSLVMSLFVFLFLFLGFEIISRQDGFNRNFPLRSLGSYHTLFEIKWFKLRDYVNKNGGVDVILMGSSEVNTGIDPEILSRDYESLTGKKLRIFNIGLEGLTIAPNSKLANIIDQTFHPGTILFVTEMRDYIASNGLDVESTFESNPWIRGHLGTGYSIESWLISNSTLLQKLLVFRNWSRYDFRDNLFANIERFCSVSLSGYEADLSLGKNFYPHPDPNNPGDKKNFDLFKNFKIDPGRLTDLLEILHLKNSGVQVFITEMPIYPTYFEYLGNQPGHQPFQSQLRSFISDNGGIYVEPVPWELIPFDGREDYLHLNYRGAFVFSTLLAQRLANECLATAQCLSPSFSGEAK
jgi:hypothetical protein